MLVSGDSAIRRMSDTGGKRIAVIRGTTTDRALAAALAKDAVNAEIVRVDSREQGVAMLTEGRADAFASDRFLLLNIAGSIRSSRPLRLIDEDFSVEPMRSRFRAMTGLPARGQSQPRRIFRSGEINRVYARWLERFGQPSLLLSALYYLQAIPE
jgi:glutamate/aspartate transport system substrate-binding protein